MKLIAAAIVAALVDLGTTVMAAAYFGVNEGIARIVAGVPATMPAGDFRSHALNLVMGGQCTIAAGLVAGRLRPLEPAWLMGFLLFGADLALDPLAERLFPSSDSTPALWQAAQYGTGLLCALAGSYLARHLQETDRTHGAATTVERRL